MTGYSLNTKTQAFLARNAHALALIERFITISAYISAARRYVCEFQQHTYELILLSNLKADTAARNRTVKQTFMSIQDRFYPDTRQISGHLLSFVQH